MRNGTKTLTTLVKEELNRHPCADTKSLAKILPIQRRTVIANKRIEELINERNVPTNPMVARSRMVSVSIRKGEFTATYARKQHTFRDDVRQSQTVGNSGSSALLIAARIKGAYGIAVLYRPRFAGSLARPGVSCCNQALSRVFALYSPRN